MHLALRTLAQSSLCHPDGLISHEQTDGMGSVPCMASFIRAPSLSVFRRLDTAHAHMRAAWSAGLSAKHSGASFAQGSTHVAGRQASPSPQAGRAPRQMLQPGVGDERSNTEQAKATMQDEESDLIKREVVSIAQRRPSKSIFKSAGNPYGTLPEQECRAGASIFRGRARSCSNRRAASRLPSTANSALLPFFVAIVLGAPESCRDYARSLHLASPHWPVPVTLAPTPAPE